MVNKVQHLGYLDYTTTNYVAFGIKNVQKRYTMETSESEKDCPNTLYVCRHRSPVKHQTYTLPSKGPSVSRHELS
jgi:hypothetical protein